MTPAELVEEMIREFRGRRGRRARKYVGGLLPAFALFLKSLETPGKEYKSLEEFFKDFPQITDGVSALTVTFGNDQRTIRPHYDAIHERYITDNSRLDYPRSAPYATGKWGDYRNWLTELLTFSEAELDEVVERSVAFVLQELPEHAFDASTVVQEPPLFSLLLREFNFGARAKGEPTGAAFQAMVFGYIRADAPHLQVQATKVRAGAARTGNVGDIDAWDGDRLVVSAEVKHTTIAERDTGMFTHFAAEVAKRGAFGTVVAEAFGAGARDAIEGLGLRTLNRNDLIDRVAYWDTVKQRIAINAFLFVVVQIEQQSGLIARVRSFIDEQRTSAAPVPHPTTP